MLVRKVPSISWLATTFLVTCGLVTPGLGIARATAEPAGGPPEVNLPPVDVVRPQRPRRPRQARITPTPAPAPAPTPAPTPPNIQSGSAGSVGYLGTRTSTGTKTDTPIINIPQSITVLTKEFIKDQNFQ